MRSEAMLLRGTAGRPVAGAAMDAHGNPSWWSRLTRSLRLQASTMREARDLARRDARKMGWEGEDG